MYARVCPWLDGMRWLYGIVLLFAWIMVLLYAPVNHPNLHMTQEEVGWSRRDAIQVLSVITIIIGIMILTEIREEYITYEIAGVGIDAVLICIAKICEQEVKENVE